MKKKFSLAGSAIVSLLLSILYFQCTKKDLLPAKPLPGKEIKYDIATLKQWFESSWPKFSDYPSANVAANARTDEESDTIPRDFVADRFMHINPQWTAGHGLAYDGFTLYEIPLQIENDMLFKLMPTDINTDIDTLSNINPGSVSYLIVKENEQERVGEIMTIVPAYEYLQEYNYDVRNINLHINAVYQNENLIQNFTGRIMFHDQFGHLLREMIYVRGSLTYLNRYDPTDLLGILPPNLYRAASPCEHVIVVWRRCTQIIVDDEIVNEYCTPWVTIGTYQVGDCSNNGGGVGTFDPAGFSDNGRLSCKSFKFTKIASNWQECGVRGLQLVADWFGAFTGFSIKQFGDIFVGVPIKKANGEVISAGRAAEAAALAANRAAEVIDSKYRGMLYEQFNAIPATLIAQEFRSLMQGFLSAELDAGCRVDKYQSGNSPIRNAVWNSFWSGGGSCN